MLTEHRDDNEGNKKTKYSPDRSSELYNHITNCSGKSLTHWETWLAQFVVLYLTVEPVDEIFFNDSNRRKYWERFGEIIQAENALVFIDPDTGLESGSVASP